jgi:hypothetical protein
LQVRKGWRELEMISPGSSGKAPTQVVIKDGIRSTSIHLPLMEWDYRLFRFRSMGSFPVRTEVGITKAAISLKVNNLSRRELTECWLAIAGQGLFLGEVAPGSSLLREIALSPEGQFADGGHERPGLWQIPFKDGVREALLRYSIFPQDQGLGPGEPGSAYLMCWVEKDQPRVWMRDPRVMVRNYTLFRSAFAIREDEES